MERRVKGGLLGSAGVENERTRERKRRKSIREEKPVPERSADSQIREIELKPISAPLDDAAK